MLLATNPIDVLAINETWLDSTISNNELYIPGYDIIRRDRVFSSADGKTYGGVCFYVRSSVNFIQRNDMSIDDLENLCIQIQKPNSKPFLVATWYRPPNSSVDKFDYFETFIDMLDAENAEYYSLGDLNCDLGSTALESSSRSLIGITELYGLHQLISEPTRITETSSTMIDLIFTNTPDKIVCSGVSHVGISDHSLIYAFRKLSTGLHNKGHSTVNYRKFKNFNSESFRNDTCSQNWDVLRAYNNPNDMWLVWKTTFNNVVEMHAPCRTRRVRLSKSPWITPELKRHMHERDILKIKAIRSKDIYD